MFRNTSKSTYMLDCASTLIHFTLNSFLQKRHQFPFGKCIPLDQHDDATWLLHAWTSKPQLSPSNWHVQGKQSSANIAPNPDGEKYHHE